MTDNIAFHTNNSSWKKIVKKVIFIRECQEQWTLKVLSFSYNYKLG
jgi:hypothetical protein